MLPYALTILISAFLLFQVQPLIAKFILPWFGGTPAIWTTAMLFFQTFLLLGYAYAHFSIQRFKLKTQVIIHGILLGLALLQLPIIPSEALRPTTVTQPTLDIMVLLALTIGLPYLVLSATSPLIQAWFNTALPGRSPYRLYALSNTGSLFALISFPFIFEPVFTQRTMATMWSIGFGVYVLIAAFTAYQTWRTGQNPPPEETKSEDTTTEDTKPATPPTTELYILWAGYAVVANIMLLAITNQMTQDVASIPFLWVLPLSLYLITFIIAFDAPRWYVRPVFVGLLIPALAAMTYMLKLLPNVNIGPQIGIMSVVLFLSCMVMHGELARSKPHPNYLTGFYLMVAVGGAVGGFFVAIIAPAIFNDFLEVHVGLAAVALLTLYSLFVNPDDRRFMSQPDWTWLLGILAVEAIGLIIYFIRTWMKEADGFTAKDQKELILMVILGTIILFMFIAWYFTREKLSSDLPVWAWIPLLIGCTALMYFLGKHIAFNQSYVVTRSRNFYGVLAVEERNEGNPDETRWLIHGVIYHGLQYTDPLKRTWPTSYFGPESGAGLLMTEYQIEGGRHIGVLGMGVGTLTAYTNEDDILRIYEINPQVKRYAESYFTYLDDSPADVTILLGDGRLVLEQEESQQFDILFLDAFSSDSIPVHLLTVEAFEVYMRHMKPDGVIVVNVVNRHLDIEPVVEDLAAVYDLQTVKIISNRSDNNVLYAEWMLMTNNEAVLNDPKIIEGARGSYRSDRAVRLWTDDYSSLFPLLYDVEIPWLQQD